MSQNEITGVVLVGCGTVGGGAASILHHRADQINQRTGLNIQLTKIVDINFDHAKSLGLPDELFETDLEAAISAPETKIVIESVGGTGFAKAVFIKSLEAGKTVVSANKALLAESGVELFSLAREKKAAIGFEASCGGGIPIIQTLCEDLMGNEINGLYGIFNGTCNYILTEMLEKGRSFDVVLQEAQKMGLAEADPTLDISGMDTAHKITLLASLAFSRTFQLDDIPVTGIQSIDGLDVGLGGKYGMPMKLLAFAEPQGDGHAVWVGPAFVLSEHPLSGVKSAFNAASVYGDALGHGMFYGRGAGDSPTASAVVADIIAAASGHLEELQSRYQLFPGQTPGAKVLDASDVVLDRYIRISFDQVVPKDLSSILSSLSLYSLDTVDEHLVLRVSQLSGKALETLGKAAEALIGYKEFQSYPIFGYRREFPVD